MVFEVMDQLAFYKVSLHFVKGNTVQALFRQTIVSSNLLRGCTVLGSYILLNTVRNIMNNAISIPHIAVFVTREAMKEERLEPCC